MGLSNGTTFRNCKFTSLARYQIFPHGYMKDNITRMFTFQHHLDNSKTLTAVVLPEFVLVLIIQLPA